MTPDPNQAEAVRSTATSLMVLALIGVVLVVTLLLIFVLRRGRSMRNNAEQRKGTAQIPDAWAEAGRRATVPDTEDEEPEPGA